MPELLIFLAIAAVPLGVTWSALLSGTRQSIAAGARVQNVHVAQIAFETIRDDLAQILSVTSSQATTGSTASGSGAEPGEFSFLRFRSYAFRAEELYAATEAPPAWMQAEEVTYRFNRETHQLERNGRPIASALFDDARLSLVGGAVAVHLVLAPEEMLVRHLASGSAGSEIPENVKTVLDFHVSLPQPVAQAVFSSWVENPFDRPPTEEM
jgi:hypothetical protein